MKHPIHPFLPNGGGGLRVMTPPPFSGLTAQIQHVMHLKEKLGVHWSCPHPTIPPGWPMPACRCPATLRQPSFLTRIKLRNAFSCIQL